MTIATVPMQEGSVSIFPGRRPSRWDKLGVARDLLAALETATIPGQHYLMDKVIDLLGPEVLLASKRLSDPDREIAARAQHELSREAARLVPDDSAFCRRAKILMDVLAASDMFPGGSGATNASSAASGTTGRAAPASRPEAGYTGPQQSEMAFL